MYLRGTAQDIPPRVIGTNSVFCIKGLQDPLRIDSRCCSRAFQVYPYLSSSISIGPLHMGCGYVQFAVSAFSPVADQAAVCP